MVNNNTSELKTKYYFDSKGVMNSINKGLSCHTMLEKKVFNLFFSPGDVVEVRIVKVYGRSRAYTDYAKGTVSGYFDNFDSFYDAVAFAIRNQVNNIYFTLQGIDPRLIGRAYNRLKPSDLTTSDNDVRFYRWIPVDLDPVRPAGVSSSDAELQRAIDLRDIVREFILDTTDFNKIISAVSGNGAHLLVRLPEDIPVNDNSKNFVKDFLERLDRRFSTPDVKIDTAVHNPARIWKLYGSKAMKGDEIPGTRYHEARVHRGSFIDRLDGFHV